MRACCRWSKEDISKQKSKTEIIVFGSGGSRSLPDGVSKEEGVRHFTELLADIGPIAEEYGITVVVEPLASEFRNFINSVAEAGRIVKDVDHPDIKLLADFYHMSRDSQGPGDLLKYGEHIRHIHLAEKERRTPPGIDRFDFMPYLKALAEAGYSGAFSFEAAWDDLKTQAAGSAAYFRSLIDKAGF